MKTSSLSILAIIACMSTGSYADMMRSIPQRGFDQSLHGVGISCGSSEERLRKRCDVRDRDEIILESFSLPGGLVRRHSDQSRERHAWFGAQLEAGDTGNAGTDTYPRGVRIAAVNHHTPAAYAGLAAGDFIIAVDGTEAGTARDVIAAVKTHRPGQCLELTIRRNSSTRTVPVILGIDGSRISDTSLVQATDKEPGQS